LNAKQNKSALPAEIYGLDRSDQRHSPESRQRVPAPTFFGCGFRNGSKKDRASVLIQSEPNWLLTVGFVISDTPRNARGA
jgi:hypothetical protein